MTGVSPKIDYADEAAALQRVIEGDRPSGATVGPGGFLYWALAHHISASDVAFADIYADPAATTKEARTGRIFLLTQSAVMFVDYLNATDEQPARADVPDFGSMTLTLHPLNALTVQRVEWKDRPLWIRLERYGGARLEGVRVAPRSIAVAGQGWSIDLPLEPVEEGDAYFARLRAVLRLAGE